MKTPAPILVAELFPEVRQHLLSPRGGLTAEDWLRPTAAKKWNVKDVALHFLGGDISNLSRRRDAYAPPMAVISGWDDLVIFINGLNESWVGAARRISPRVWGELLAHIGAQVDAYFLSLDPFALGGEVSWAGSPRAPVWPRRRSHALRQNQRQPRSRWQSARDGFRDRMSVSCPAPWATGLLTVLARPRLHGLRRVTQVRILAARLSGRSGGRVARRIHLFLAFQSQPVRNLQAEL
jgi:hypothetical protein